MSHNLDQLIRQTLRDVPDFPKEGIIFKDITPILAQPAIFQQTIEGLASLIKKTKANAIAGIEARGFIFGATLALHLQMPFIPIRKPGKLPWKTQKVEYDLEYGSASIEIHEDALELVQGEAKVAVVDDLLATGGTAKASSQLIQGIGGQVELYAFVVELGFLNGRQNLDAPVESLACL